MTSENSNLHQGHRARMRQRFLQNGAEGFADHELLELLLFYALPRKDTNDLAHRLVEEFGSFDGVLEADVEALAAVEGMGESSATYLRLLGESAHRYAELKMTDGQGAPVFDTPEKIAAFMMPRYFGVKVERAYLLLLDNSLRLLDCFHVCDGSVASVLVSVRRMAERAMKKGAAAAILTHNHPGGVALPSGEDMRLTRELQEAFRLLEIPLLEHYIFAGQTYAPIMSHIALPQNEERAAASIRELSPQRLNEFRSIGALPSESDIY